MVNRVVVFFSRTSGQSQTSRQKALLRFCGWSLAAETLNFTGAGRGFKCGVGGGSWEPYASMWLLWHPAQGEWCSPALVVRTSIPTASLPLLWTLFFSGNFSFLFVACALCSVTWPICRVYYIFSCIPVVRSVSDLHVENLQWVRLINRSKVGLI